MERPTVRKICNGVSDSSVSNFERKDRRLSKSQNVSMAEFFALHAGLLELSLNP